MGYEVLYHPAKVGYFNGSGFFRHEWREANQLHRSNGPAVERFFDDGSYAFEYFHHGIRHRLDGPALQYKDGGQIWYINGETSRLDDGPVWTKGDGTQIWMDKKSNLHRVDGPAVIYPNGSQYWYQNGKLHREDGPAITDVHGTQEWWINNNLIDVKFHRKTYENVHWQSEGF